MTISGGRTGQLDICCHVTGFMSDFLFHSCATYSVLSRSPSFVMLCYIISYVACYTVWSELWCIGIFLCASVVIISHFRIFFVYFELLCSIVWTCSVGCEFSVLFIYLFALYLMYIAWLLLQMWLILVGVVLVIIIIIIGECGGLISCLCLLHTLSVHLNCHFSRWTWVCWYQNVSILDFIGALRMMEVVVTTGAIRGTKAGLKSEIGFPSRGRICL